jgi:exodeoxyribonuclease VII large subunit
MTLPLFPDPPITDSEPLPAVPDRSRVETRKPTDSSALHTIPTLTAPLSIRKVAELIHERLRPLAALGRQLVHAQWIRPGINAGARGFLSVTLADTQDNSASIDGFIWERAEVQALLQQGHAFGCDLSDREGRCEVMLEVTIDFWAKKTKPYLRIHGLNYVGMKGLRQQQREATLRRLEHEGLLTQNKTVPWRRPALRVLCIGKQDSDGCRDAITILGRSGFRFQWTIQNVAVQGVAAVPTLVQAFSEVGRRQADYDVVLLIRGGGSELDLLAYDEYAVAHAVACCPLPVVTGLGHTADHSVCDAVSAKALETPTAAARFLVDTVQGIQDRLRLSRDRVRAGALDQLHRCRRRLLAQRPHFVRHALSLVHLHQQRRASTWYAISRSLQSCLHRHRRLLQQCHQPVWLHARRVLQAHRTWLSEQFRTVMSGSPALIASHRVQLRVWQQALPLTAQTTLVGPMRLSLRELRQRVHHVGCETVRYAQGRLHRLHAHIQAASPDRYYALGLSYVTGADGSVVRRCSDVRVGNNLEIHLCDGSVLATVTRKDSHDN